MFITNLKQINTNITEQTESEDRKRIEVEESLVKVVGVSGFKYS